MKSEIHVEGLRELQRELRAIDPKLPRELRKAHMEISRPIAEGAARRLQSLGGTHAKAARSIRPTPQQRAAIVSFRPTKSSQPGSPPIPPFGPEFGGGKFGPGYPTPRGGHTTQFKPHRGRDGLGIFPELREQSDHIKVTYLNAIDRVTKAAFPLGR